MKQYFCFKCKKNVLIIIPIKKTNAVKMDTHKLE